MTSYQRLLVVGIGCLGLIFAGCGKDEKMNDLASAQACLDNISHDPANPSSEAQDCLTHLKGRSGQQANILKCSLKFIEGGLTTGKIMEAYKKLEDSSGSVSKESIFIGTLGLSSKSAAKDAQKFCKKSKLPGLIYLANVAVMGTEVMNALPSGWDGGIPTESEVQDALDNCESDCDAEAIGEAAITVAETQCSDSDSDTCQKVNDAIDSSDGSDEDVGSAVACLLDGGEYDSDSGTCSGN